MAETTPMSLQEWCNELPAIHPVHAELAALEAQVAEQAQEIERLKGEVPYAHETIAALDEESKADNQIVELHKEVSRLQAKVLRMEMERIDQPPAAAAEKPTPGPSPELRRVVEALTPAAPAAPAEVGS